MIFSKILLTREENMLFNALRSPVILAGTPGTISYAGTKYIVAIVNAIASIYDIPRAIHLVHFENTLEIKRHINSLAVAIGTAHGLYKGKPKLDLERLKKIRDIVNIPLVLHGASDVPDELVRKAISLGINKVNIATDLKIPFSNAIKKYFNENPDANDPRKYLTPAKAAMKEIVKHKIEVCGSVNRV